MGNYNGPERRKDHDLLIMMARDIKHMCRKNEQTREEIKEELKAIHERIDVQVQTCGTRIGDCNKIFVPNKIFYSLLTIFVLVLGTIGTIAYETKTETIRHKSAAEQVRNHIEDRLNIIDKKLEMSW